ncbi:hypothetical protein ACHWQZ_G014168 [Mnemiopsis leidyi]
MPKEDINRETLQKRRESYDKQRSQMQRFKYRLPNNTPNVNFSLLNHYHLYLRRNPGINSYCQSFASQKIDNAASRAAYSLQGRVRQSMTYSVPPRYDHYTYGSRPCLTANTPVCCIPSPHPTTPHSMCDDTMLYPDITRSQLIKITGNMINTIHPSTDLKVYKRLMGDRDLAKEADVDSTKLSYMEKTALACKSTNYKCFKGPKLQWQCMGSGVRRASLLTRNNTFVGLPKLSGTDGQRPLAI